MIRRITEITFASIAPPDSETMLAVTTGVSYLPSRRILKYRATEALRGKML